MILVDGFICLVFPIFNDLNFRPFYWLAKQNLRITKLLHQLASYTWNIGIEFSDLDEPTISIDQKKESETHT